MAKSNINRRAMIGLGAVGLAGLTMTGCASAASQMKELDPDMAAIEMRMLDLAHRATSLTTKQKYLVLFSVIAALAAVDEAYDLTVAALGDKISPSTLKEALYQTVPYVGISRVNSVLTEVNRALKDKGIRLPLASQTKVTDQNRFEKGLEVQTQIFGEAITKMHASTPQGQKPLVVDDLTGYCFGDFYTRGELNVQERELVTFAAIAALGGCEPQLKAHAVANLSQGNTKQNLIDALHVAVLYLGFPRTLNALAVINSVE